MVGINRSCAVRELIAIGWFVVVVFVNCGRANTLSSEEMALLETIVASYEANRQMVESLYLEYDQETEYLRSPPHLVRSHTENKPDGPWIWPNHVRYAFSGEERLFRKEMLPTSSVHFVQNGESVRVAQKLTRDENKWVQLGHKDAIDDFTVRGDAYPWALRGLSKTARLLLYDPEMARIMSVQRKTIKGRKVVVVVIESGENASHDMRTIRTFSEDDGYTPTGLQQSWTESGGQKFAIDLEVTEILTYDINGSTFYLPGEMKGKMMEGGKTVQTWKYAARVDSVKINPDLPDELFTIPISPGDTVEDMVTGIILASGSGKNLLSLEDLQVPIQSEGVTTTNEVIAADDAEGAAIQTTTAEKDRPDAVLAFQDEAGQSMLATKWV